METKISSKTVLIIAAVVIVVAVILIVVNSKPTAPIQQTKRPAEKSAADMAKILPIKTFSLSGEVTKITGNEVSFKAPVVVKTDKGNVVQYKEKSALTNDKTVISKTDAKGKVTALKLSDLKVGTQIVVYTSDNVFEQDNLTHITKIDVK